MKILETKHLKKYYGQGSSLVKAVDDISISVEKESLLQSWEPADPEKPLF